MNHHQNNDVPAVTTKLDGVVLQRTHVMKERATVMVLVMVVYMMVMMVVREILSVEATTVRSLATIIMKRMIAVNSLRQLNLMANLKLLMVYSMAGVLGWSLVNALNGLMVTVRKPDIDIVLITVVDTLNNHKRGSVVLFVPIMLILVRNQ